MAAQATRDETIVKICGITEEAGLRAALDAGAEFVGLVFYPPSPRAVTAAQARHLLASLSEGVECRARFVGLFVDPSLDEIRAVLEAVTLDIVQLHGAETPAQVRAIKQQTGLPVIKALPVGSKEDLKQARLYEKEADWLLFDARPQPGELTGGRGEVFDWALLEGFSCARPWLLAGGLDAGNVGEAIRAVQPWAVDVSSGVEDRPDGKKGRKSPLKIREFVEAVRKTG